MAPPLLSEAAAAAACWVNSLSYETRQKQNKTQEGEKPPLNARMGVGGALEHLAFGQQVGGLASQPTWSWPVKWGCPRLTVGSRREEGKRSRNGSLGSLPSPGLTVRPGPWPSCVSLGTANHRPCIHLPAGRARPWHRSIFQKDTEHLACCPVPTPQPSPLQTLGTQPFPLTSAPTLTGKMGSSCRRLTGHLSAAIRQFAGLRPWPWSEQKQDRDAHSKGA